MQRIPVWLGQRRALAILAVTALSLVAYLPEELRHYLGPLLVQLSVGSILLCALALALLLIVALMTYRQITAVYPQNSDAYSITRDTLGRLPRLLAGGGLVASYVLAVAVPVSAGAAAVAALWPTLVPYRIVLAVGIILLSCLLHIRGWRVPTMAYALAGLLFTCSVLMTFAVGAKQMYEVGGLLNTSHLPPTAFVLLMVVAVGCAMIVGACTLTHGRVARLGSTMVLFMIIVATVLMLLVGTTWLAVYGRLPSQGLPVVSDLAHRLYGVTLGWYLLQGSTAVILLVAAQAPFAGATRLISMIARDGELPRQFAARHDPRSRADASVIFALCSAGLVLYGHGLVTQLLPWYIVSSCFTFLLAQAGMASRCAHLKLHGWRCNLVLHGIAVLTACITFALISSMTQTVVVWAVALVITILIGLALCIHYLTILARQSHRV